MGEILSPQQMADEASSLYQNKRYEEAAKQFRAAAEAYRAQGEEGAAAEMMNNCSVAYLQAGNAQAAYDCVEGTALVFERLNDQKRMAMAYANRGAAFEGLKEFDKAIADYEKSGEILKEIGEDEMRLQVMQSLSALQLKMNKALEALASMQVGVDGLKKTKPKYWLLRKLLKIPFQFLRK